ncbi:MAG: ribose 5-phosphate isomerase B [Armatimonadetes bacterium]|nr:ribose 5-phosphate isomerase B [Armatimonadota bacterium]NIM23144.1 ribose 5-phosphate isomerase B [Armatimonadota bacterium]NIM67012.1 ribose 5-phosphate isomerase B [Armatimonadota bacterium]NIM75546.1 ribose 5-phosphate isomerase B [Armatimonadota bacterium]NIN05201.1 ribose 5-phosphate isomerase B [Armatimonadota bacterium]
MKVALGADHAGFHFKESLKRFLEKKGLSYQDLGCDSAAETDYTDFAKAVAFAVAKGEADRGIVICGTGIGSCMAANKVPGVRAALCHETFSAIASRQHNDANVLCLGARVIGEPLAQHVVNVWLDTAFSGDERHRRRIKKISEMEGEAREAR